MKESKGEFVESFSDSEIQKLIKLQEETDYFTWQDANSKGISINMWGKSIEKGIIKEHKDGYQLTVEFNSLEDTQQDNLEYEIPKWDYKDKAISVVSILTVLSFGIDSLRDITYTITNIPFSYVLDLLPLYITIILLSAVSSAWSVFIGELLDTSTEDYQSRIRDIREGLKDDDEGTSLLSATGDMSQKQSEEVSKLQIAILKSKILPLLWSTIITIPIIIWIIVTTNTSSGIATITYPIFGESFWAGEVFGPVNTWIPLYALSSLLFSQALKKLYYAS